MKIWVKLMQNEKIVKDTVVECNAETVQALHYSLADICDKLNCPTPLVTQTDLSNLHNFNFIKYYPKDFVDNIYFDVLEVVRIAEKKKSQENVKYE